MTPINLLLMTPLLLIASIIGLVVRHFVRTGRIMRTLLALPASGVATLLVALLAWGLVPDNFEPAEAHSTPARVALSEKAREAVRHDSFCGMTSIFGRVESAGFNERGIAYTCSWFPFGPLREETEAICLEDYWNISSGMTSASFQWSNLTGATGTPIGYASATYLGTLCPTGVNSFANGNTCVGQPWP